MKVGRWLMRLAGGLCALGIGLLAASALAQDQPAPQPTRVVTADMVNAIARGLYCPVCPNERLDTCQTEACFRWREDIRRQLEQGRTESEIVADFVRRYGERAVGTPLDPTLRAFSVLTPYVLALIALALGVYTFLRWRARRPAVPAQPPPAPISGDDDAYRRQLERDLRE